MDAFTSWLSENGLTIILAILAVFAIKGNVKFDLNQWLKDRRQALETNLRALCPHVNVVKHEGKTAIRPLFVSPPGTAAWRCERCGVVVNDPDYVDEICQYWIDNIDALVKRNEQMNKLAKKLGRE